MSFYSDIANFLQHIKDAYDENLTDDDMEKLTEYIQKSKNIEEAMKPFEWDCSQSPTGKCQYSDDDNMNDECIHCGMPEERK